MQDINERYAKLLVNYSLSLQSGDKLLIASSYLAEDLVKAVYKEALKVGAYPELLIGINGTERIFFDNASEEQLKYVSPLLEYVSKKYDAFLHIRAPFNMKELENVDTVKKQTVGIAGTEFMQTILTRAASGEFNRTLCVFPTDAAAQECGMSRSEYADFVYSACFLYEDDPVAEWKKLAQRQQRIVDFLDTKEQIRYLGKDIDISFSTKGRRWVNSMGTTNMPSGEVFTTPVEDSVNGKIRFSFPGFYFGQEVGDISLEVKDGEVVKWDAGKGKDLLDKILEMPGAKRFGEAAIGTNKRIKKFTKNILFDEKIGGTIHMAVGAAIPQTGGKNECGIHWDMLADMRDGGQIFADGEVIYESGDFII